MPNGWYSSSGLVLTWRVSWFANLGRLGNLSVRSLADEMASQVVVCQARV